ncbi:MAG: biotin/lipoyl-containing protein [Anaerolineaceae bacterium]|jgi:biotin carboxyl carrier protein
MKIKVKIDEQVFEVEINDLAARPIMALVDGQCFEVWPEEDNSPTLAKVQPVEKLAPAIPSVPAAPTPRAASAGEVDKGKAVLAPIPAVILSVAVCAGATVKVGQELCVLEAMKMKNAIRSTRAGVIANVYVSEGDHVKHGQVLVDFAD